MKLIIETNHTYLDTKSLFSGIYNIFNIENSLAENLKLSPTWHQIWITYMDLIFSNDLMKYQKIYTLEAAQPTSAYYFKHRFCLIMKEISVGISYYQAVSATGNW